jgi:transglutaminase-like putative cysteine protease
MLTNTPEPIVQALVYQEAFGIDYTNPTQYLVQGEQSKINDVTAIDHLRGHDQGIDQLTQIYRWLQGDFSNFSARGSTIGTVIADELLESRQLGGCHDYGLLYAAIARELGYPAVMIDTYSIAWIESYQNETAKGHIGHVFVEIYMDEKWVLVDPTNGWYVEVGYDPSLPVIPLKASVAGSSKEIYGFYVDLKGIDSWSYGVHNNKELTEKMDKCASELDLSMLTYPDYTFQHFE